MQMNIFLFLVHRKQEVKLQIAHILTRPYAKLKSDSHL